MEDLGDEPRLNAKGDVVQHGAASTVVGGPPASRAGAEYDESALFDEAGRLVFSCTPRVSPRATLVIASSLFAEFQRNYRREVLLSRAAAAAGLGAIRFHYRGVGNSVGEPVTPNLDTMADDLAAIVSSVATPYTVIAATRLGALAAVKLRDRFDLPLVLWEPVLDGTRWVEEVIRASMARRVAEGDEVSADSIREGWRTDGEVFVLGETVPASIVDQVATTRLLDGITSSSPILLVQMGRNERVRPDIERARKDLTQRGVPTEVLPVVARQAWWVNEGGDLFRPLETDESTDLINQGVLRWAKKVTE